MAPICGVCGSSTVYESDKPHRIMCPLHVAAPDLLAAAKTLLAALDADGALGKCREAVAVRVAIAMAEGE
jgi:hypothetical protein